jgi:hypothetical protein
VRAVLCTLRIEFWWFLEQRAQWLWERLNHFGTDRERAPEGWEWVHFDFYPRRKRAEHKRWNLRMAHRARRSL